MPLYIRDEEVATLAREVQHLTRSQTLTEAVRHALRNEIARQKASMPLRARLGKAMMLADRIGAEREAAGSRPTGAEPTDPW